jgi:hypothetical protein
LQKFVFPESQGEQALPGNTGFYETNGNSRSGKTT